MNIWISINEKLPTSNTMVLLFAPKNYHTASGITFGFYDSYANKFLHQGSSLNNNYVEVKDQRSPTRTEELNTAVTHWMQLPNKPKNVK